MSRQIFNYIIMLRWRYIKEKGEYLWIKSRCGKLMSWVNKIFCIDSATIHDRENNSFFPY